MLFRSVVLFTTGRQAQENGVKPLSIALRELESNKAKLFVLLVHNSPNTNIRDFTSLVERRRDIVTETSFEKLKPKIRSVAKMIASRSSKYSNLFMHSLNSILLFSGMREGLIYFVHSFCFYPANTVLIKMIDEAYKTAISIYETTYHAIGSRKKIKMHGMHVRHPTL